MKLLSLLCVLLGAFTVIRAQTYTHCNPLQEKCEPDPALGRTIHIDFSGGPSTSMMRTGSPTIVYDENEGALFNIANSGNNPTLQSKFYIMFGKVTLVARASDGAGIVSSLVLQSDDLDEIDFEFVGSDPAHAQTNYFGKGDTSSYDRGKYHNVPGRSATSEYHTYTVEWNADVIKWYIDEQLVRSLHSSDRPEMYPQTPMTVRIGSWTAGDPAYNEPGTIEWAGGRVDYAKGPFVYAVKELTIQDYSTGTNYEYTDRSGDWTSIKSQDGQIGATGPASQQWLKSLMKVATPL